MTEDNKQTVQRLLQEIRELTQTIIDKIDNKFKDKQ